MNRGSATNLHQQHADVRVLLQTYAQSSSCAAAINQLNIGLVTYVLTRVETANAMAMVTASSLLIGNLLLLPELCAVSSSSSVSFMLTSAHATCLKGSVYHKV